MATIWLFLTISETDPGLWDRLLGQGKPSRKQPRGPQTRDSAPHLTLPRQKPRGRNRSSTTGKEASPPAAVETRLNSPATGAPSISGTAEVEETLTSGVADEDGKNLN